jgi:serine/threonine-protein kinase
VRICTDAIPPPSAIADDLPPGIDAFFERALQREAEARFPSIQAMVRAFATIAEVSEDVADIGMPDPVDVAVGERTGLGRSAETAPLGGTLGATIVETDREAITSPARRPEQRGGLRGPLLLGGLAFAVVGIGAWFIVGSPSAPIAARAPSSSASAAPDPPNQPPRAPTAVDVPPPTASEAAPARVEPQSSPPKTSKPETRPAPKPRATSDVQYDPFSGLPLAPGRR